jgi:acylphosphatase
LAVGADGKDFAWLLAIGLRESGPMSEDAIRRRVKVHGRVQGVFFRDSLRQRAESDGVAGWAGNQANGTVEAVLEGPPEAVERVLSFMRSGPPRAEVRRLEVTDEDPEGLSGFSVR